MQLTIPEYSLVVLVGATGAGKSTFARKHFLDTEVLSSDAARATMRDDTNDPKATKDAFDLLAFIAQRRLAARKLCVIDATNTRSADRERFLTLAKDHHAIPIAIILETPEKICRERTAMRRTPEHVIRTQTRGVRRAAKWLKREGFRQRYHLKGVEETDAAEIIREPLHTKRHSWRGPCDIIGDVHGCHDELLELLEKLGYEAEPAKDESGPIDYIHPKGRGLVFLGDLVDRGPKPAACLELAMNAVEHNEALCVPGNHDARIARALRGKNVERTHGIEITLDQLEKETEEKRDGIADFIERLPSHYELDNGRLIVAHAGLREDMQGGTGARVRSFCLYGETTGETDEFGLPIRTNWARDYRGDNMVVYGHTPVERAEWLNNTICLDTGCVFGGSLTALRYPENEIVSVRAKRTYTEPAKPIQAETEPTGAAQQASDEHLDIEDVHGKVLIHTQLMGKVTVYEGHSASALAAMSRFSIDPRWLIYLPPTMSPCGSSPREDVLEHPDEAFAYFRQVGITNVVCEEKHMGSRAIVIVGRTAKAIETRFGIGNTAGGTVYTRTGRRFFDDAATEAAVLERIRAGLDGADTWNELNSDWVCLDTELMPWSAKAKGLVQRHYAPVAEAANLTLGAAIEQLRKTAATQEAAQPLLERYEGRKAMTEAYDKAYQQYDWPVAGVDDLRIAPFHLLASEGKTHVGKGHDWHLEKIDAMCAHSKVLQKTDRQFVTIDDNASRAAATSWWEQRTANGAEGMVVKPDGFIGLGTRGLSQPGLKVRGREYLRIIYGPEYTTPEQMTELRKRRLGTKRMLALREFALGIKALESFVDRRPLRETHQAVFGVLALECEAVDPRL